MFSDFPTSLRSLLVNYQDAPAAVDPYSDAYNAPPAPASAERDAPPPRGRSRSRSPVRSTANGHTNGESDRERYRSPQRFRRRSPPPRRGQHLQPNPSNVLGVFGLSIRTQERDLEDEFSRYGSVEKVTIVYDQRSDRSRGFGFIRMGTVEEATKCIEVLMALYVFSFPNLTPILTSVQELNGRRIRVDYSVTDRPHASTPGEYMGHRRNRDRDRGDRDRDRDVRDRDRDRDYRRGDRDRDRDRDHYGRDKDWRDRRSPPYKRGYSPEYRRRRSYSRSPPPRGSSPPRGSTNGRDYDAPTAATPAGASDNNRW
ncbi:hypothetical protein CPB84DRAFT_1853294 [Gymnopilus junonius]|uniref:RRM domain-containing protein n=1 Tax=Gymnopilus junonius TaxID=109634 RepID=A0A9P5THE1_GYMJU|nr:hypothetical protein CPB84DRAFT_1853294 [Gymnopilus junonius]